MSADEWSQQAVLQGLVGLTPIGKPGAEVDERLGVAHAQDLEDDLDAWDLIEPGRAERREHIVEVVFGPDPSPSQSDVVSMSLISDRPPTGRAFLPRGS